MALEAWSYAENIDVHLEPEALKFHPNGAFYKDMIDFCTLAKIRVHPCFRAPKPVIVISIVYRMTILLIKRYLLKKH